MIPDRFFGWLRSGRPELLVDVLDHNREDVVSLGRLLGVMAEVLADPVRRRSEHPGDLAGLARAYERSGRTAEALACYGEALGAWDEDETTVPRAGSSGPRWPPMAPASSRASIGTTTRRRPGSRWRPAAAGRAVWAWIAVAKIREHKRRDVHGALEAAEPGAGHRRAAPRGRRAAARRGAGPRSPVATTASARRA